MMIRNLNEITIPITRCLLVSNNATLALDPGIACFVSAIALYYT